MAYPIHCTFNRETLLDGTAHNFEPFISLQLAVVTQSAQNKPVVGRVLQKAVDECLPDFSGGPCDQYSVWVGHAVLLIRDLDSLELCHEKISIYPKNREITFLYSKTVGF
jgi:hypothetical protein